MNKGQSLFIAGVILVLAGFYTVTTPSETDDILMKLAPLSGALLGFGLRDMMGRKK